MTINEKFPLKDNGFSNTESNFDLPRHRWYYFKEGFSPSLVEYALNQVDLTKNDIVLDPFNGSGTVTLTCAVNDINAVGIEVNPFAAFLAKAKIANTSLQSLEKGNNLIVKSIKKTAFKSPLLSFSTFSENKKNNKWLFNQDVLNSYYSAFLETNNFHNPSLKKILRLALIGAALDNSNAVRDGKCLKYRKGWEDLFFTRNTFLEAYYNRFNLIKDDILHYVVPKGKIDIYNGDSRSIINDGLPKKFKLCITSPPYLNSFDYTDVYRPELFLGNFIKTQNGLRQLRKRTLRSHAAVSSNDLLNTDFGYIYNKAVTEISKYSETPWQKKIPIMIQAYFEDMAVMLKNLKRNAAKGAELWLVVSNSAYNDVDLPVDLILADIGCTNGWKLQEIGVLRDIHKRGTKYSPRISSLRESVIILKA